LTKNLLLSEVIVLLGSGQGLSQRSDTPCHKEVDPPTRWELC